MLKLKSAQIKQQDNDLKKKKKKDLPSVAQPVIRFEGIFRTGPGMFG